MLPLTTQFLASNIFYWFTKYLNSSYSHYDPGFPEKEASVTVQHYDTSKDDLKILSPQSTTLKEKV